MGLTIHDGSASSKNSDIMSLRRTADSRPSENIISTASTRLYEAAIIPKPPRFVALTRYTRSATSVGWSLIERRYPRYRGWIWSAKRGKYVTRTFSVGGLFAEPWGVRVYEIYTDAMLIDICFIASKMLFGVWKSKESVLNDTINTLYDYKYLTITMWQEVEKTVGLPGYWSNIEDGQSFREIFQKQSGYIEIITREYFMSYIIK